MDKTLVNSVIGDLREKKGNINESKIPNPFDVISKSGYLWNIGQISSKDQSKLDQLVKKGELKKDKLVWPWGDSGTIKKTVYYDPSWDKNHLIMAIQKNK